MTCGLTLVDRVLTISFYKLGLIIGKQPGYFIIVPILVTLICATGFQRIYYQMDPEYLFSPIGGDGKSERALVEKYFKTNYSNQFNVGRITRAGRFGRIIATTKDGDQNMLRADVWKELRLLDNYIQNITSYYDDDYFSYKDICAKWQNECFENDILNLDAIIDDVESNQLNLSFPIMLNPVTWDTHIFPVFFGGTEVDEDGYIKSVPSLQLVYFIKADTKRQRAKGAIWEDKFLDLMGKLETESVFKHISISRFSSRTLDHELERNTQTVIPYIWLTFLLMIIFSTVTSLMADWVRSKPYIGLCGVISSTMATLAAFGFCMYLGIEFIGLNLAAPFLMIGVGIDDTFVMLSAWRRSSMKDNVPKRTAKMLSEAAVSVTITSVTDMFSFLIGIVSEFPSVKIFCLYSAVSIVFLYIWHLTFFTACIVVAGYCERSNRHSLFCFKVQPLSKSSNRSWLYQVFCSGGIDINDPDNPKDNQEHLVMVFFRDFYANFLNKKIVKLFVISIFIVYLIGAMYGIGHIEEGLDRRKVAKPDSYSIEFFDREDLYYREFPYRIQVILTGNYNYSDTNFQLQVENLTRFFENTSYVSSSVYTESWLRSFLSYVNTNEEYLNISISNEEDFINNLKKLWLFPENTYSLDVKFNENNTRIIASRFLIQAVNISDTNHEKEMVRALRNICHNSPLNVTIFHPYFVYFDQFELVRPTAMQSMVIGGIIMMIVSFIMIPNIMCSFWVAFCIISIEIGVLGYMSLWGISLDSISMINLIMCTGFSVDFTAHICYAYMSSNKETSDEKVKDCLYTLGFPILQGALSTIIGVIGLLLANSYLFVVFFKMVFLVIVFGAMHGLLLLPVLLSLFGPRSSKPKNQQKLTNMSETQICTLKSEPIYRRRSFQDFEDLGLGTSCEASSESSSNKSQRRAMDNDDEQTKKKYEERWRKTTQNLITIDENNPKHGNWVLES